jgi:class 3 adenylate cyclase
MEPISDKHHGFIDKYIGDAIMANLSLESKAEALAGIQTGILESKT